MMARKRRDSSTVVDRISLLPEEILVEILLRVPADGLVQLRRVSKCCREVINRPDFARTHLSRWRSRSGFACNRSSDIFYVSFDDVSGDDKCLKANRHELRVDCRELRDRLLGDCRDQFHCCWANLRILGSCDGLLLILGYLMGNCSRHMLMVCNPATRRCSLLPNYCMRLNSFLWKHHTYWMFVHGPSVRSYKVVGVSAKFSLICMIRMDPALRPSATWNVISVSRFLSKGCVRAYCSINGKLHLLLSGVLGSSSKVKLLSVNLATEEVSALDLYPTDSVHPDVNLQGNVFGINGAFYHVKISLPDNNFELWVLKDFDAPTWFSCVEIIDLPWPPLGKIWKDFQLLRISEDAQRFIFACRSCQRWNNTKMFMYEMKTRRWKKILWEGTGFEPYTDIKAVGHVQSLIHWN